MGIKNLLVVADSSDASESRIELAAYLAAEHGAHLVGLYVLPLLEPDPARPDPLIDKLVMAYIREDQELARAARLSFDAASDRHGIKGEWRTAGGFASEEAAIHARYADLTIVGQIDPGIRHAVIPPLVPEEVAFAAGRPILVTPFSWKPNRIGRRVLVAWNARREAARTVSDALPILCKAEWVTVLVVNPEKWAISPHGEEPGAEIALYLARHGVKVQAEVANSEEASVCEVVRARAHEGRADLIVIGAYGHSRTRELILGGVTRDMLRDMTIPVFMSH
jgi:nucleotide-binding universal stress UspA family protein